jgi:hypothetical protein
LDISFNDQDFTKTGRNIIILLAALSTNNIDEATDAAFHLWYSSFITKAHYRILQETVKPRLESVCNEIAEAPDAKSHTEQFTFATKSLVRVTLPKFLWFRLVSFVTVADNLTTEDATLERTEGFVLGHEDWEARSYMYLDPDRRVGWRRWQLEGILLPFGASRDAFTVPNP